MIENISDEQARHMVDILKKKSKLIKNFYHKIEKDRLSRDKQTYKRKLRELLEKEEIKVYRKEDYSHSMVASMEDKLIKNSLEKSGKNLQI